MRQFIDLEGASGATYRFRIWPDEDSHPPVAGNYVVVCEGSAGPVVVAAAASDNLSTVEAHLQERLRDQAGARIFTRLNTLRAVRLAENADIVAHYQPAYSPPADGDDES
jgi:hypothetical protein